MIRGIAPLGQKATLGSVMMWFQQYLKCAVASVSVSAVLCAAMPAAAVDAARLDGLFARLPQAHAGEAAQIEDEIALELARSGSDAMDLLLERGRDALAIGDFRSAIEHFTALIDHAPDFAEGYNGRATAYYMAGLYGPSMQDIGRVLTVEPRHFGALSGLALILEATDGAAKALEVLYAIREVHPHMTGLSDRIARLELHLEGTAL
ncbi:tetratricopeptide repeat protein [Celeribacter marinus]|uniref:tetratricopeptide repeat protein n=1 Tax=Celeribacter marinus TaxID=1397108 RepID=UPI0031728565